MKRKVAIVLAAIMALVCLAGCGTVLGDEEFCVYDENGAASLHLPIFRKVYIL